MRVDRATRMIGNTRARRRWITIDGIRNHVCGWAEELMLVHSNIYHTAKTLGVSVEDYLTFKYYVPGGRASKARIEKLVRGESNCWDCDARSGCIEKSWPVDTRPDDCQLKEVQK